MRELIFRDDCNLFDVFADSEGMIRDLMAEYNFEWDEPTDIDKIYEFARELLQNAQNYIDTSPMIGTDEAIAVRCPECKNVYIEYDDIYNSFCPVCGIKYKIGGMK